MREAGAQGALFSFALVAASAGVFGLLVILSPVISTVFLGTDILLILTAPYLGAALGATATLLLYRATQFRFTPERQSVLLALNGFAIVGAFLSLTYLQVHLDKVLWESVSHDADVLIEHLISDEFRRYKFVGLFALALPFSIYGFFLVALIAQFNPLQVYKNELIGAILGTAVIAWVFETYGLKLSVAVVLASLACATVLLASSVGQKIVFTLLSVSSLLFLASWPGWVPQRSLHLIARDFARSAKIQVLDEKWTTYSKVQTMQVGNSRSRQFVAIGDGIGIADLARALPGNGNSDGVRRENIFVRSVRSLVPQAEAGAVLFAGAGSELVHLDALYGGQIRLIGIEINPHVIRQGYERSALRNFVGSERVLLKQGEARQFVEYDEGKYDFLIYSWSGAPLAYYAGVMANTTQFAFTVEGLKHATNRISKNGFLVIGGGSKLNHLLALKSLENRGLLPNSLSDSLLILGKQTSSSSKIDRVWDDYVLVWKNGVITKEEVGGLDRAIADDYQVLVSPRNIRLPHVDEIFRSADLGSVLKKIRKSEGIYFDVHTDDRPFVFNYQGGRSPFEWAFWEKGVQNFLRLDIAAGPLSLFLLSILVVLAILVWRSDAPTIELPSLPFELSLGIASFLCGWLGAMVQIQVVFQLMLKISNPTWVLILGVCIPLAGGVAGSILVQRVSRKAAMGFSALAVGASSALLIFLQNLSFAELLIAFLATALLWGMLFPFLLRSVEPWVRLRLKLWSLDIWGGLSAVLFVPILAVQKGFQYTQNFGLALLLIMLFAIVVATISLRIVNLRTDR